MAPTDYLLPLPEVDWASALAEWQWLLPEDCTPKHVTYFGDLFLASDSDVWLLDLESGTFERYCESTSAVLATLQEDDEADVLLYVKLVDELRSLGSELPLGRCYHFKIPTVLGGEYDLSNIGTNSIDERVRFCGDFHRQIKDLPDGAKIEFKFTED